ncbi:MAG: hypothetical protein WCT01_01420 [Candidatus Shapirobacteria bacterium]
MSQKKLKKIKKIVTEEKRVLETNDLGSILGEGGLIQIVKTNWMWILGIMALAVLTFVNGMKGDFVSDDYASITQFPRIGDFGFMVKNTATFVNYLVYSAFGNGVSAPYHWASMVFYLIDLVLIFSLGWKISRSRFIAVVGTLIFAVHPIHAEAVSWISGRIYLILAMYILMSFWMFIRFLETHKWGYLVGVFGTFLLGFLTDKPRPFTIILLVILFLVFIGKKNVKISWTKLILGTLGVGIVGILVAYPYVMTRIEAVNGGINSSGSVFYNPFFQYPTGFSKYLQLLLAPVDLTLYHTMYVFPIWLNWAIILSFGSLIVYFYFKNKQIFFWLSFMVLAIMPSMAPIKVSWLVAERYAFLGSVGFCMFLATLAQMGAKVMGKYITYVFIVLVVGFFGLRSYYRNIDWKTNHLLWVNTCQVSPNSHNAWNNIGDDYDKLKDYPNAIKGFTQSVLVKPNYADAYHNRANILFKTGRLDLAREMYETGLRFSPGLYQSYISLVQIDLMEKRGQDALGHLEGMVKIEPNNPQTWYVASIVFENLGDRAKALEATNKALTIDANFGPAREMYMKLSEPQK